MNQNHDINDNEIRIISPIETSSRRKRKRTVLVLCAAVSIFLIGAIVFLLSYPINDENLISEKISDKDATKGTRIEVSAEPVAESYSSGPCTIRKDTIVNGIGLTMLTPMNATPVLAVGNDVLNDSTIILLTQAADIRDDNGKIVGAFVMNGELIGKGEAKAGFCSIINGSVTVGVAEATPMLEQALTSDGYFFRQYPLVVGGQVVENKPKGTSIRRALAEIDGKVCVIVSSTRISFHDFSQALADAGVSNAIYLVGGNAFCEYKDSTTGRTIALGQPWDDEIENVNYIVWR